MSQQTNSFSHYFDKFSHLIEVTEYGCLLWLGRKRKGYSVTWLNGTSSSIHKLLYETYYNKKIALDIDLHHLCLIKCCVSPLHLEELPHVIHSKLHRSKEVSLDLEHICRLRKCGYTLADIAKIYTVRPRVIRMFLKRNSISTKRLSYNSLFYKVNQEVID